MNVRLRWSRDNEKLNKPNGGKFTIVGFGIPADQNFTLNGSKHNTCPSALACKAVCYAKQDRYIIKNVREARTANLRATLRPTFVQSAIEDLNGMPDVNVVRIHDSGDFYSQEYYDKWCQVARAHPAKTFYAYTKMQGVLDLWTNKPPNLQVTQSLGGKHDNLVQLSRPHSRIFATPEDRKRAGYCDGNSNDVPAIVGERKIGLVYHGTRKLTPSQRRYFA